MSNVLEYVTFFIFIVSFLPIDHCKQNSNNEFIIEYFLYRGPSTVVGFTCNKHESKYINKNVKVNSFLLAC